MEGSGIKDLFDVDKLNAFLKKAYDRKKGGSFMDFISSMAGPLALPIKILSKLTGGANNGEYMLVDDKDINDMVLAGHNVMDMLKSSTYSGLEAKIKFNNWKKI
jgi:hypothetical protein